MTAEVELIDAGTDWGVVVQCIEKEGRYFFVVRSQQLPSWCVGVAVADEAEAVI